MYEDRAVELEALPPRGRIFCIASAGCTAFELAARGDDVTAVDVNPAQVAYVRQRVDGAPPAEGKVERLLGRARVVAPLLGWRRRAVEDFCALDDVEEQARFWREQLQTVRFAWSWQCSYDP